ncbi:DUF2312 domain-containing protein, partial [Vibrio parahaemolyticus]|nr:DUF2312 domain-containing protein [Vibrio parahaemolyticus]
MSRKLAEIPADAFLRSFVDRLVLLWRERAKVARVLKEAKKATPPGVPALQREIKLIDADIRKVRAEAADRGFAAKAVDIVVRETMETEAQRLKR